MKEKILLDVPSIVEYEGENWNVGKVDHMDNTLKIWRCVTTVIGNDEIWSTEERIIDAGDAYKTDKDSHYLARITKEW